MIITRQDSQIVGATSSTLFTLSQAPSPISFVLQNTGVNILAYDFQTSSDNVNFTDIAPPGSPTNNTLLPGQITFITFTPSAPNVQCVGYASGGSTMEFAITSFLNRPSGAGTSVIIT